MVKRYRTRFMAIIIFVLVLVILNIGCTQQEVETPQPLETMEHPKIEIEMEDGGKMLFELYPELAPATVENFVKLAESGFYDGLKFHRIMKGFMVQGGDPKGDGTGGSEQKIKGEFSANGFNQNTLKHTKGVISMARSNNPDSARSQFFIMHGEVSHLDGKYAAFGRMIEGEETLDKIANTPVSVNLITRESSVPKVDVVMKEVRVLEDK